MAKKEKEIATKPIVKNEVEIKVVEYDYCFNLLQDEKGVRIAVGNQIVTGKIFEDLESAEAYVDSKPWQLIMAAAHICLKKYDELKNK